jgi:hypothetical protein
MRDRETESAVARAIPPPQLRQFTDPSRPGHRGDDLGVNVYSDRAGWLAARQEWARKNGMTVPEWLDLVVEETRQEGGTLGDLNVALALYFVEEDDFADPRLAAA